MERAELLRGVTLDRRILKYGPRTHGQEWVNADIEDQEMVVYGLEAHVPHDEVGWRRMPFNFGVPQIVNRLKDWNIPSH